jgi:hypothetical protein
VLRFRPSAAAAEEIESGHEVEVELDRGVIRDLTRQTEYRAQPLPEFMRELVQDGGLMAHVKRLMAEGRLHPRSAAAVEGLEAPKRVRGSRMRELEAEAAKEKGRDAPWDEEAAPLATAPGEEDDEEEEEEEEEKGAGEAKEGKGPEG